MPVAGGEPTCMPRAAPFRARSNVPRSRCLRALSVKQGECGKGVAEWYPCSLCTNRGLHFLGMPTAALRCPSVGGALVAPRLSAFGGLRGKRATYSQRCCAAP